jgi:diguanylate cyclase (GGDEF)-like protein
MDPVAGVNDPPVATQDAKATRPAILLIDDEPDNLDLLRRTLHRDFQVFMAQSGTEGLKILKQNNIAVILADQRMPGMTGAEFLAQAIRCSPSAKRVIITAYADIEAVIDSINSGRVHYFIRKPWDSRELHATLDHLLELQRLEQENSRLVDELRDKNCALEAQEALLRQNLDERGRDLLAANNALESANAVLRRLAYKDGLTGLYNHRAFQERLREEVARARRYRKPVTLLFLDIDHFKEFNDAHGHPRGDQLLRGVGDLLTAQARGSDICARYGGEEFCLLLPETPKDGGRIKAERLRDLIRATPFAGSEQLPGQHVTISVGVAEYPADASTADDLLTHADHALYVAKRQGRDRVQPFGDGEAWSGAADAGGSAAEVGGSAREPRLPQYQQRMSELVDLLERERVLECLLVDLSRLRRVEQEYGSVTHANLLWRAGEVLREMKGARLRESDLVCRMSDDDAFVIFLAPPRTRSAPIGGDTPGQARELEAVAERIAVWLDRALAADVHDLLHDLPRAAVGYGRVLANPMIKPERQVSKLIEEARESASVMHRRRQLHEKETLQQIILQDGVATFYQPIVALDSGEIFGYEALSRGPRKTRLESPLALFAMAEDVDLLFELDRACFRAALRRAHGLQPVHRLFINILPPSFYDNTFIGAEVDRLLEALGIAPANVVFEITERLAIENFGQFRKALNVYTSAGFGVAIDDVGTRHSNLEAIIALRPNFLKLSDVMTRGIARSAIKREMIRSLLKFAQTIDAVIVAEGIESSADLRCLRTLGVRYGQGYHLARPGRPFPKLRPSALRGLATVPPAKRDP